MFKLSTAFLLSMMGSASALNANSSVGKSILSEARSLDGENSYYSWIMDYSIKFASCHTVQQFTDEAEEGQNPVQYKNLVKFKLCPSNKCGYGCKGADYLVDMNTFVNSWTEFTLNQQEYDCEIQREQCETECQYYYGDDEKCENNCFYTANMGQCVEEEGDDDGYKFDLQEWLECAQSDAVDPYGNALFVGPTCSSSGQQINLGVFYDEDCTVEATNNAFAAAYGISLPYQDSNIIAENCVNCKQSDNNGNNNGYYQNYEMTDLCEESYVQSAKCETNLAKSLASPITSGCDYVNNVRLYEKNYKPVSGGASVAFAVFFGLASVALAGVAVHLFRLKSRQSINLNPADAAVV
mmetsp:Transcript_9693/g.10712  ORF Transcript_9693/g.10712 Transcript_9693/m.10712 type:complete len:353 (+) Transcript_9693:78-1136(+)